MALEMNFRSVSSITAKPYDFGHACWVNLSINTVDEGSFVVTCFFSRDQFHLAKAYADAINSVQPAPVTNQPKPEAL